MKGYVIDPCLLTHSRNRIGDSSPQQLLMLRLVRASQQPYFVNGENNQQLGKIKNPAMEYLQMFLRFFIFFRLLLALMSWHVICNAYRSSFAGNLAVRIINLSLFTRRLL
jgi:hypothetical protein